MLIPAYVVFYCMFVLGCGLYTLCDDAAGDEPAGDEPTWIRCVSIDFQGTSSLQDGTSVDAEQG